MSILKFRFDNCRINVDGTNMKSIQFKPEPGITAYSLRNALAIMQGELPVTFLQPAHGNISVMRNTPKGGLTQWWVSDELIRLHERFYALAKSARIVYDMDYSELGRFTETISAQHCGEQKYTCYGKANSYDIVFNGHTYAGTTNNKPFTYSAVRDIFYPIWDEFELVATSVCKKDIRSFTGWELVDALSEAYRLGNKDVMNLASHMAADGTVTLKKFADIVKSGYISNPNSIIRNNSCMLLRQTSFAPRSIAKCTVRMGGSIYLSVDETQASRFLDGCGYSTLDLGIITLLDGESGINSEFDSIDQVNGIPPVETPNIIVG